jgi:SAM-dependent methyltransferase
VDIASKMKRDWDRRAGEHARFWIATEDYQKDARFAASGEATAQRLLAQLPDSGISGWSVLEIGCGIGRVLRPLAPTFRRLCGVDVSGEMIAQSHHWLAGLENVETHVNSGVDLGDFSEAEFDLVYSYIAFQHMPRPVFASYLRESNRVLREGGRLLFQVFVGQRRDPPFDDTISLRVYEPAELAHRLTETGFEPLADSLAVPIGPQARDHWVLARRFGTPVLSDEGDWRTLPCPDRISPMDVHLQRCLAAGCMRDGNAEDAIRVLERLVEYDPGQLEAWLVLVSLLLEGRHLEAAVASLKALVEAHPQYGPARESLAQLLAWTRQQVQGAG